MKLETYSSLEVKSKIFEGRYRCVDNWETLNDLLNSFENNPNNLYRGMCEAKHKNYTSIQRYYLTHELEKLGLSIAEIIYRQIEQLRSLNGGHLDAYYNYLGIKPNWYLLCSFLQHYGGKTPLLDFSRDHSIALYFMQDECQVCPEGKDDINNYCSLYYIKEDDMETINKLIENTTGSITEGYNAFYKSIGDALKISYVLAYALTKDQLDSSTSLAKAFIDSLFTEKFYNFFESYCLNLGIDNAAILLNEKVINLDSFPLQIHERIVTTTNLNSVAQKGVFLITFGIKPLEDESLHCIDIHKSLLPTIRKYIKDKGITRETIYPQEETIAQQAFEQSLIAENYTVKK